MRQIIIDEKGYITAFSEGAGLINGIDIADEIDLEFMSCYRFIAGALELDEIKKADYIESQRIAEIRQKRETECFPIINRGKLWYDTLTVAQLEELDFWYTAWLNAPETKLIPLRPEFLQKEV